MALGGCSGGLLVTAAVALLLLPAHYYVPDRAEPRAPRADRAPAPPWLDRALLHVPPLDLFVTVTLLGLGLAAYLCEWIQRKMMERRIVKLNERLSDGALRLRAGLARRRRQGAALRLARAAALEYALLLRLLLAAREPPGAPAACRPKS